MTSNPTIARRGFLASSLAGAGALTIPGRSLAQACESELVINPLIFQRADPWVTRDGEGRYLFTASVPEYDRIILRRSDTLAGLSRAAEITLWHRPVSGRMGGHIWAPEIHQIGGRWCVYFAAGDADEVFRIRTYALACEGEDPMDDRWSVLGQLQAPWDSFCLDATSFQHRGTDYLCWAQHEPGIETNSNLYLAPLATPLTFAAPPLRLTVPTLDWEIQGYKVNEGPALLKHGDKLFLTYSASATDERYAVGMLTAHRDADLMDLASWAKSPVPVMTSAPDRCVFGPGHNSFTTDECGRDVMVFHARGYADIEGDPLYDPNRHTRVQHVRYDDQGIPVFNPPAGAGPLRYPSDV
ncbi:family 43 glycosylhydrolase [Aurantiacibacter luteus]|uniref:Alpha-N-arabinofuranosidase n=1 Tax=Aurantiacibacter luteus TaxID=1581420 RepID=A0A0G9MZ24_9SPHN|nr:family 43 glycosylhydrolase [Aurantiacibacter luteus]KLE35955.1 alpha-N-arabinofuranosidase [Aurantiacibacter luteus]